MNSHSDVLQWLDIAWVIVYIAGAAAFCHSIKFKWIDPKTLFRAILFKAALGIGFTVWAILTNQDFDSVGYYYDGQEFAGLLRNLVTGRSFDYLTTTPFFGYSGISTDRLTSLTGLLLSLDGNSLVGCALIIGCLGLVGQLLIYRYLRLRFPDIHSGYFVLVLFHPSLVLWSGMLGKDAFGILALGLLVYHFDRLMVRFSLVNLIGLLLGVQVALAFRSFILVIVFVFLLTAIWDRKINPLGLKVERGGILKTLYLMGAIAMSIGLVIFFIRNYGQDMVQTQSKSVDVYNETQAFAGSSFNNAELSYSLKGLWALPMGVVNSLLRPFPWEVVKPSQVLAALEHLVITVIVCRGWSAYVYRINTRQRQHIRAVMWGFLFMSIICASGVGLYSSNLGSISRYRIPLVPLYIAGPCIALGYADKARRDFLQQKTKTSSSSKKLPARAASRPQMKRIVSGLA